MQNHWRVISLVSVWHVAASICYYTVYVATPFFRDSFQLTRSSVGVLLAILALGYVLFLLPIGAIVDSVGEKYTLFAGLIGLSLAVLVIPVVPTVAFLAVIVFVLGACYGTATPGTNKAIFSNVPADRRNLGMGIKQLGNIAGTGLCAILLTGIATTRYGWIGGFVTVTLLGLLTAIVFYIGYYGPDHLTRDPLKLPNITQLVSNQSYRRLSIAGFFIGTTTYTTIGYTILYITESVGLSIGFAGIILGIMQFSGGAGRVLSGWLGDWLPGHPQRRTIMILGVQTALGTALLFLVPALATPLVVLIGFTLLGFFILGLTGMYFSCVGTLVPVDDTGSASAVSQLTYTAGGLVSPPTFGYLADTASYAMAWIFLAVLGSIAVIILVRIYVSLPRSPNPATT